MTESNYMPVWILIDDLDPARSYVGRNNPRYPAYGGVYYLDQETAEKDMTLAILQGRAMRIQKLLWPYSTP